MPQGPSPALPTAQRYQHPPAHPTSPISIPRDGCHSRASEASPHHPTAGFAPCSRAPQHHPTGSWTQCTGWCWQQHWGALATSQPCSNCLGERETYGKICTNRGLKFNGFLRAGLGSVVIRQHNVQLFSLHCRLGPRFLRLLQALRMRRNTHFGLGLGRVRVHRGLQADPKLCKPFG